MKFRSLSFAFAVLAASIAMAGTAKEPKAVLLEIKNYRDTVVKATKAANKHVDNNAIFAAQKAMALDAIKDVDIQAVEPAATLDWAQVYLTAGEHEGARRLANRFIETSPAAPARVDAESVIFESTYDLGDGVALARAVHDATVPNLDKAGDLVENVTYLYSDFIASRVSPEAALWVIDETIKKLDDLKVTKPEDKDGVKANKAELVGARAIVLADSGQKSTALTLLDNSMKGLKEKDPGYITLKKVRNRVSLIGSQAPELPKLTTFGQFSSLGDLKGKVVLIDFFAHWCGPCRIAFPETREMYADLKEKGLEIVGFTDYQGYYKYESVKKRDMPKPVELAHLGQFIKDQNMTWPVVLGKKEGEGVYGAGPIPEVVVIDKKGVVRLIRVGYDGVLEKDLRAFIEKLLAEN